MGTLMSDPCWRHWVHHVSHHGLITDATGNVSGVATMYGGDGELPPDDFKPSNAAPGHWMDFSARWKSVPLQQDSMLPTVNSATWIQAATSSPYPQLSLPVQPGLVSVGL